MIKISELLTAVSRSPADSQSIAIKDLSVDELVICIRELTSELNATPLDMSNAWSVDQLKDELMALEFQGLLMRQGDSPIPLIPFKGNEELDRISKIPVWLVHLNFPKRDYYWVSRNQLISLFGSEGT